MIPGTVPTAPAARDASIRAFRTFVQGLGIDVAIAVVIVLLPVVSNVEWTRLYWLTVAGLVGKTVVMAVVSYAARRLVPPPADEPLPRPAQITLDYAADPQIRNVIRQIVREEGTTGYTSTTK
jgi:hypothetical protein